MRSTVLWVLVIGLGLTAFGADAGSTLERVHAQRQSTDNPFEGRTDAARAGAKLYSQECAACHGSQGEGIGKAPPLVSARIRSASPGALFWILRNGSLRRGMPSFAHLPEAQRWQIVTYLKTIQKQTGSNQK